MYEYVVAEFEKSYIYIKLTDNCMASIRNIKKSNRFTTVDFTDFSHEEYQADKPVYGILNVTNVMSISDIPYYNIFTSNQMFFYIITLNNLITLITQS